MELLRIEFLKIKKFNLLILSIITSIPAIIISSGMYNIMKDKIQGVATMEAIFGLSSSLYVGMLLNLFIIYSVCTVTKIEGSNNGWRGLLLLPIKRWKIYISKISIIFILLAISLFSFFIFNILATLYLGGQISFAVIINLPFVFIASMPIILLLYIVARNVTSIVVPLVIGIFFTLTGFFVVQSDYWIFAPWTYPIAVSTGALNTRLLLWVLFLSLLLSIIFFLWDLKKFITKDLIG